MQFKQLALAAAVAATAFSAQATTEIQWWHSMTAVNNEWVNDLAKQFNESQKDYKIVPTFKGVYDESMTAAIAAFRSGNAPDILQVFGSRRCAGRGLRSAHRARGSRFAPVCRG